MLPRVNAEGIEDDAGAFGRDLTLECGPDVILKSGLYMRGQFIGKASRDKTAVTAMSLSIFRIRVQLASIPDAEDPELATGARRMLN